MSFLGFGAWPPTVFFLGFWVFASRHLRSRFQGFKDYKDLLRRKANVVKWFAVRLEARIRRLIMEGRAIVVMAATTRIHILNTCMILRFLDLEKVVGQP